MSANVISAMVDAGRFYLPSAVWAERPTPAPAKSAMPGRRKQTNHLDIDQRQRQVGTSEDLRTSVLR